MKGTRILKGTWVRPQSMEERIRLLDFLEKEGFRYERGFSRYSTVHSKFPIGVNMETKRIFHLLNVTCAAASVKWHISPEEFYRQYDAIDNQ